MHFLSIFFKNAYKIEQILTNLTNFTMCTDTFKFIHFSYIFLQNLDTFWKLLHFFLIKGQLLQITVRIIIDIFLQILQNVTNNTIPFLFTISFKFLQIPEVLQILPL